MKSTMVALVTGAGSGIGYQTCKQFSEQGISVIGLDANEAALRECEQKLGAGFEGIHCDIADEGQVSEAAHLVAARHDKLDYLVNNAGVTLNVQIDDLEPDDYDRVCDAKVKGTMLIVKHFFEMLAKSEAPAIVTVGSAEAEVSIGRPSFLAASANAALENFTRSCTRGFPSFRSNTVSPGFIDTPYLRDMIGADEGEEGIAALADRIPSGRIGRAEEVANMIIFLCSDKASYVNGANIVVDGGLSCQAV